MVQMSPGGPPKVWPSRSLGARTLPPSAEEYIAHISWLR